jgi:hypothetical protein
MTTPPGIKNIAAQYVISRYRDSGKTEFMWGLVEQSNCESYQNICPYFSNLDAFVVVSISVCDGRAIHYFYNTCFQVAMMSRITLNLRKAARSSGVLVTQEFYHSVESGHQIELRGMRQMPIHSISSSRSPLEPAEPASRSVIPGSGNTT